MSWKSKILEHGARVLDNPAALRQLAEERAARAAEGLQEVPQRLSSAWKILRHGYGRSRTRSAVSGESNRDYWNRMAESGQVNWHIAHRADDEESQFWSSGNGVMQRLLRGSSLKDLQRLPANAQVLDIGCGRGRIARAFANQRADLRVVGVDVSTSMIENARASNATVANLQFQASDESGFPGIESGSCELVYSYVVFQHLPRYLVERILTDCHRVLTPTGELVFQLQPCVTPEEFDPPWNDYRTVRKYTEAQIRHILRPLFHEVRVSFSGTGHDMFVACTSRV